MGEDDVSIWYQRMVDLQNERAAATPEAEVERVMRNTFKRADSPYYLPHLTKVDIEGIQIAVEHEHKTDDYLNNGSGMTDEEQQARSAELDALYTRLSEMRSDPDAKAVFWTNTNEKTEGDEVDTRHFIKHLGIHVAPMFGLDETQIAKHAHNFLNETKFLDKVRQELGLA